ncbi:acylphosphatase [Thermosulfuriphilus ammonigenes]|uniref:Acylphosphatase n=1 Tax=Thermosulfuriphilus ammonigenes TaxID=1936021 RepID=A0A6G7PVP6_9BACT|nr:acylphosphatase [Thermosulfuriphilus ammonigenes]MBA2848088.1 acylphosphatase [Thermosulfuriphilus ammonigenes]QIJ71732.1 acylphosphatase [Thermosulfuriphilus ammonigenes]HFB83930.1 acylphosphatase [Thermodesulfatator sp.]
MAKKRVHVFISGKVQGVFFRAYTQEEARRLGLRGWVRNLPDGRVEAIFEGEEKALEEMIRWCHKGSPGARVTGVEVIEEPYTGEFSDFRIRY